MSQPKILTPLELRTRAVAAPLPQVGELGMPTWPIPVMRAMRPGRSGYEGKEVGGSLAAGLGRAII